MGSGITQTKREEKDCRRSTNETLRERTKERKKEIGNDRNNPNMDIETG
jgi:hypothetical protein